jgi:hypothetical protein
MTYPDAAVAVVADLFDAEVVDVRPHGGGRFPNRRQLIRDWRVKLAAVHQAQMALPEGDP